ncbi:hypothetical protein Tco_1249965 [Tanacetum coccineum]
MSASGTHLLTWMPRGRPRQWWLANQRPPCGSGADISDCRYEVQYEWQLAIEEMTRVRSDRLVQAGRDA